MDPGGAGRARARGPRRTGLPFNRARALDRILERRAVSTVDQPIVDLGTREVLA